MAKRLICLVWVAPLLLSIFVSMTQKCWASSEDPNCLVVDANQPLDPELDRLLDKIEKRGAELKSFQAEMLFKTEQPLVDAITMRDGELYYQKEKSTVRFRIHFDNFLQQDLAEEGPQKPVVYDEDFVFDGQWVTRRNARTKSIQRWEVSKQPGNEESFRLGKGPFPLPFALKKSDILKEFDVKLLPSQLHDPKNTDYLLLKPGKDSSFAEKYVNLELWVAQELHVPVQFRYETDDNEITTVTWLKIKIDKSIEAKKFQLRSPGRDWTIEETPLKESGVNTSAN